MSNPVITITGGSAGLGYALAKQLLEHGFAVAICARDKGRLESAATKLQTIGPVYAARGDVTDVSFQSQFVSDVMATFGRIDSLVLNASTVGATPLPPLLDSSSDDMAAVYATNAIAPVQWIQRAAPHLRNRQASLIVGISSDAAVGGYPTWGVYGASKAALDLYMKTLAAEWQSPNAAFYAIDPGDMATDLHESASPGDIGLADPNDVAQTLLPLFLPLLGGKLPAWTTGSRLRVNRQRLEVT